MRVLSIQSHVVHGYVGNKAATFPLQLHGFDVDPVNTVHFSNHTGYKLFTGERLQGEQLAAVFSGLRANDFLPQYTHVLTGYIGSASIVRIIVDLVKELRQQRPDLIFVCDPVLGDDGKLYVAPELVPLVRDELAPLADVITPNHFELELLSGVKITDEASAWTAIETAHAKLGVRHILLTSTDYDATTISTIGSTHGKGRFRITVPRLSGDFSGTGDLCAALTLAWLQAHPDDLATVGEKVTATLQAVLERTVAHASGHELRLIQSKDDIEHPHVTVRAERLS